MPAGEPSPDVALPVSLQALMAGRSARLVWKNEVGGLTFEVGGPAERCFVKWTPTTSGIDLGEEVARLDWAVAFTPVPRVLDQGADDVGSWIVTSALPGENAVSEHWRAQPGLAVAAIGRGLRALHDALPVASCPFRWSAADRVKDAQRRAAAGRLDSAQWHEVHRTLSVERVCRSWPMPRRSISWWSATGTHVRPTPCSTRTAAVPDTSTWARWVSATAGPTSRWPPGAPSWNYGPGWEDTLLTAYGVDPDSERTAYYRLLWDLDP